MTPSVQGQEQSSASTHAAHHAAIGAQPDVMSQPAPADVHELAWKLSNADERHALLKDQGPATSGPTEPSTTLSDMARTGPTSGLTAKAPPAPSLKDTVTGTRPKTDIDRQLALMANDAYNAPGAGTPGHAPVKNPANHAALEAAGWTRLVPQDGHMLNTQTGKTMAVDPKLLEDSRSGFSASIYQNRSGQTVVAYAGTDPKQLGDGITDIGQGIGVDTTQYNRAAQVARQVQGIVGAGNVAFTGHSLGGGLAATGALATGEAAVTFNAAGPSNDTIRKVTGQNPNDVRQNYESNGLVRSYSVAGEPLTTADEGGAPRQIGSQWVTPVTQPGVSIANPKDMIALHGGGGDNQMYVDGIKPMQVRPGYVPNPTIEGTLNNFPVLGQMNPTDRNTIITMAGNVIEAGRDQFNDVKQTGRQAFADIVQANRQGDGFAIQRMVGAVSNAGIDLVGETVENGFRLYGNEVTAISDGAGARIRSVGRDLGFAPERVDAVARAVEKGGGAMRTGLESVGQGVRTAADRTGDATAWVANKSAEVQKAVVHGVVRAGEWTLQQGARAADWVGQQAQKAANETSQWLQDKAGAAGRWLGGVF